MNANFVIGLFSIAALTAIVGVAAIVIDKFLRRHRVGFIFSTIFSFVVIVMVNLFAHTKVDGVAGLLVTSLFELGFFSVLALPAVIWRRKLYALERKALNEGWKSERFARARVKLTLLFSIHPAVFIGLFGMLGRPKGFEIARNTQRNSTVNGNSEGVGILQPNDPIVIACPDVFSTQSAVDYTD